MRTHATPNLLANDPTLGGIKKPTSPHISIVEFPRGKMIVYMKDGRIITAPVSMFPPIERLALAQRKKYHIVGNIGLMFDDAQTVYHISNILGGKENYEGM